MFGRMRANARRDELGIARRVQKAMDTEQKLWGKQLTIYMYKVEQEYKKEMDEYNERKVRIIEPPIGKRLIYNYR